MEVDTVVYTELLSLVNDTRSTYGVVLSDFGLPQGRYRLILEEEGNFFDGVKHLWVADRGDGRGEWVPVCPEQGENDG